MLMKTKSEPIPDFHAEAEKAFPPKYRWEVVKVHSPNARTVKRVKNKIK